MPGHPSTIISAAITGRIRQLAPEAERIGMLHADQLQAIHDSNWFNMYVPKKIGGLGLSLPEILRIEECLAWTDGSTAWVVTLCSGAAWFVGFLEPGLTTQILADKEVCFAGSGAVTGVASKTKSGYVINGRWKYASGSLHATVFTANCLVQENGVQLRHKDNTPVVQAFLMKRNEVTICPTWKAMGMVATGSHSFEAKHLYVAEDRSFIIAPSHAKLTDPVFQYPFLQLAETTLTVNLSGMAVRFLELCEALILNEQIQSVSDISSLLDAKRTLEEHRLRFFDCADLSWQNCLQGEASTHQLEEVSSASKALAKTCRNVINDLYPLCGLVAADTGQEINRVWRNFQTASQHTLFRG